MKTLGLIGGMSWVSTLMYYRAINEAARDERGGLSSAPLVMWSADFAEITRLQAAGEWVRAAEVLGDAALSLKRCGAEAIVICTNTMHLVSDAVQERAELPLIHIVDAVGREANEWGVRRIGLLGTRFTMEQPFYRRRLEQQGIEVVVPDAADRTAVHALIFEELCRGHIGPNSKEVFAGIVERLVLAGARGILLGCTELSLLMPEREGPVPVFDSALIHSRAAARWALATDSRGTSP